MNDLWILFAFKSEKILEVWKLENTEYSLYKSYPFTAFSGTLGPKKKEGDLQIPEGIYRIEYLNPKSKFHLSIKINYPNEDDRKIALIEGRTDLGGDIFIHGGAQSKGCIAIGDKAIEELYALVENTVMSKIKVCIFPSKVLHTWQILPEYQTVFKELNDELNKIHSK